MSIHITALDSSGTAIIQYAVWDNNFPDKVDTLTWIVSSTISGIASLDEEEMQFISTKNKITILFQTRYSTLVINPKPQTQTPKPQTFLFYSNFFFMIMT